MIDYQATSIPWLNSIPSHWNELRLKDIGKARNGLTYKPDDLVDEGQGTIVLRSSNIQNSALSFYDNVFVSSFPEELSVKRNDIIICSRNGSVSLVGKCALIEDDIEATFGAFMMRFRTNQNPKYSYYLLQATISAYKGLFGTTTVNQLTTSVFGNMLTCLPPPEEQEAIAAYLDRECEKIGQQIELLEHKADAYKRLRRSIINRAVTSGLNPDAPLKPSGIPFLGNVPQHWVIRRIKSLFDERVELSETGKEDLLSVSEYYGVAKKADKVEGENISRSDSLEGYKLCYVNDIVSNIMLVWKGSLGRTSYDGIVSPAYGVYKPIDKLDSRYYHYLFRTEIYKGIFRTNSRGIIESRLRLYTPNFLAIHTIYPPVEEQKEIVAYLDEKCSKIDAIIEKIGTKIERLKELKRSLINEVVTGKRAINII